MGNRSDRFGRDKASQRRQKIRPQPGMAPPVLIVLKRGDVVVWDRHEGVVSSITGDMADVREDGAAGRVWRLPVVGLVRRQQSFGKPEPTA
jgi:hypothetical protein